VVAPLGELHVGVVPRGELDLGRDEVQKGVPGRGKHHLHRLQNPFHLPRARDGEHLGVALPDLLGARPQAARDHHLAVFLEGLADDLEALLHRLVDEAAGVDDDELRLLVAGARLVPQGLEPGKDLLRVHQGFGAAQADKTDLRHTPPGGSAPTNPKYIRGSAG